MEKLTSLESLKFEIEQSVEEVKARAMSLEDAKQAAETFETWYYSNDRSHDEELKVIQDTLMDSSVIVQTIPEYRMVLQSVMSEEAATKMLAHENAHPNMAQSLGAEFIGYSLLICKDDDGFVFRGNAPYRLPVEWTNDVKKAAHARIYGAPEEYGGVLSDSDTEVKERLDGSV